MRWRSQKSKGQAASGSANPTAQGGEAGTVGLGAKASGHLRLEAEGRRNNVILCQLCKALAGKIIPLLAKAGVYMRWGNIP